MPSRNSIILSASMAAIVVLGCETSVTAQSSTNIPLTKTILTTTTTKNDAMVVSSSQENDSVWSTSHQMEDSDNFLTSIRSILLTMENSDEASQIIESLTVEQQPNGSVQSNTHLDDHKLEQELSVGEKNLPGPVRFKLEDLILQSIQKRKQRFMEEDEDDSDSEDDCNGNNQDILSDPVWFAALYHKFASNPDEGLTEEELELFSTAACEGKTPAPSNVPSFSPSKSLQPSLRPSSTPSISPSRAPSSLPSTSPSDEPSSMPSLPPSRTPSSSPSQMPSLSPSQSPSSIPSATPSRLPSASPSDRPSDRKSVV